MRLVVGADDESWWWHGVRVAHVARRCVSVHEQMSERWCSREEQHCLCGRALEVDLIFRWLGQVANELDDHVSLAETAGSMWQAQRGTNIFKLLSGSWRDRVVNQALTTRTTRRMGVMSILALGRLHEDR